MLFTFIGNVKTKMKCLYQSPVAMVFFLHFFFSFIRIYYYQTLHYLVALRPYCVRYNVNRKKQWHSVNSMHIKYRISVAVAYIRCALVNKMRNIERGKNSVNNMGKTDTSHKFSSVLPWQCKNGFVVQKKKTHIADWDGDEGKNENFHMLGVEITQITMELNQMNSIEFR